jgi:hypothetical protein
MGDQSNGYSDDGPDEITPVATGWRVRLADVAGMFSECAEKLGQVSCAPEVDLREAAGICRDFSTALAAIATHLERAAP